jgi:molybdenum cofactor guanylyltransferase
VAAVTDYAAVVLAGGAGRRLGGPTKPTLPVGDIPMLDLVLTAVADATVRVVVGPPTLAGGLPAGVLLTCEHPPGGGPVAATAAGLAMAAGAGPLVALLAADMPFLTPTAVNRLRAAITSTVDGALYVDRDGRRQLLCGLWRVDAVRARLAALGDPTGRSMHELVTGLAVAELAWPAAGPPPWYDCDTDTDLAQARAIALARPEETELA